jgi:hypothetical protein
LLSRKTVMNRLLKQIRHLRPFLVFVALSLSLWGQDDSTQGQTPTGAPPAATGGGGEPSLENPPLSGLDRPKFEPAFGGRSYLLPGLQLTESAYSNAAGGTHSGVSAITQGLGSVDLQKIFKRYSVGLDYIGGGTVYTGPTDNGQGRAYQVHTLALDQRILWRTGQLAIRDSFDYLPEGSFGFGSFGGAGSTGILGQGGVGAGTGMGSGLSGGSPAGLFSGTGFGSLGFQPRIDNLSMMDVTQEISPRSSVTLAAGYDFSDYLDKSRSPFPIINSQQTTAQVGYNRLLNRKDQIGFLYAFQEFHFPQAESGSVDAHIWNALYGHRITGRLNLVVGGGPQLLEIHNPATTILVLGIFPITIPASTTQRVSANATVTVGYIVSSRTNMQFLYQRYFTPGSGFLAGANTDAGRVSVSHTFGRLWTGGTDFGYTHNSSLSNGSATAGINAKAYQFWYGGASLHRQLGPHFSAFASYQFNDFGATSCSSSNGSQAVCGQTFRSHTGQIGINWHPYPIRLD